MTEYDYIEALGGGSFLNMPCTMTTTMEVEFTFLTTEYISRTDEHFFQLGGNGGDVVLSNWAGEGTRRMYWYNGGNWLINDYWTLNEEHTVTWSSSQYTFDEYTHSTSGVITGNQSLSIKYTGAGVRIVKAKVTDGGVVVNEFVGAKNNDVVGLWDKTNDIFYAPTSGTWSTGSYDTFEADKYELDFGYAGGTDTITVTADNSWSCTTPANFSVSPTSGSAGTTTVTVTAGPTAGAKSETVTFTDAELNTFDISLTQTGDGSMVPFKKIIRGTRRIN